MLLFVGTSYSLEDNSDMMDLDAEMEDETEENLDEDEETADEEDHDEYDVLDESVNIDEDEDLLNESKGYIEEKNMDSDADECNRYIMQKVLAKYQVFIRFVCQETCGLH